MAATRAARCCMPPLYIINIHPRRKFGCLGKRSGTPRELQRLKCWNVHTKVCFPTREFSTSFCLPRNSESSSSFNPACEHNDAELTTVQSKEICQFHESLDAADSSQSTIDNSCYGVCSELWDIHSSTSSVSFVDGNPEGMDGEREEVLHLGLGDGSDMKNKDLGENVNELYKVMKMKRSSHIRGSGSGCYVLNSQDLKRSNDKKDHWFPYMDKFKSGNVTLSSSEIIHALDPCIVETRKQRIREVVSNRTYSICSVVEGLGDFGNISAVFRSADALGFQSVHVISNGRTKRYRQNRKVSMGSEKWLDIEQWETTRECFEVLWLRGYRIAVAYIGSDTVSVCDMDWTLPTAIVLGNEHKGISDEALELSDVRCSIPMTGMVDSLNVSVAAGICMHSAVRDRISRMVFRQCGKGHGGEKEKKSHMLN
ncbi:uncharacterized protein LOC131077803 isoform X2 [Cryptomeria japonica]|uniref:uncharacterized protein LOC131077803 isoform X2 n=1 Tax=Cryptomeria japonica TaxID=3369 RepID=UPI0027D9E535|nr:uncharacterized protein LOC131077803 isoform X2 [Cryptomeria japonica]